MCDVHWVYQHRQIVCSSDDTSGSVSVVSVCVCARVIAILPLSV